MLRDSVRWGERERAGGEEGCVSWLAPSHLFLFNIRKAE